MAGAGYKLFNTGDVLLASEVNTYLMQQTVMVFANASARTTALSGVLAEGMLSYLADTNATEVYDGSAWVSVSGTGDITAVTTGANSGLAGGVTTGNADIKINFASKGQLAVGTGSGTTDFLNVGTNGHTLVADSATATGLKWAAPAGLSWTSFTPAFTNLTLGNGTAIGRRATSDDFEAIFVSVTFGSTTSVTGSIGFDTPTSGAIDYDNFTGTCLLSDASTGVEYVGICTTGTIGGQMRVVPNVINASGTYGTRQIANATIPFSWATGDFITVTIFYEF